MVLNEKFVFWISVHILTSDSVALHNIAQILPLFFILDLVNNMRCDVSVVDFHFLGDWDVDLGARYMGCDSKEDKVDHPITLGVDHTLSCIQRQFHLI